MKERPILFSAPMVRAILEGRKTQTRRVVKPDIVQAIEFMGGCEDHEDGPFPFVGLQYATRQNDNKRMMPAEWLIYCTEYPEEGAVPVGQVYGAIGDQLWVRESWNAYSVHEVDNGIFEAGYPYSKIPKVRPLNAEILYSADGHEGPWRPSIHMPSWASRIQLEITGIRVERLQDISEEDAIAEGIDAALCAELTTKTPWVGMCAPVAVHAYAALWESINGPGSWAANPWVWCVEFRRIRP